MKDTHTIVNPAHYQKHPSGLQCVQVTEHMPANVAAVFKYFWRAGLKESAPTIDDARKATWYANRQLILMGGESMLKDGMEGPPVLNSKGQK
jgi:uncharacterized protein DUF3310